VQNRMTALIRLAGARRPLVHVERAALLQLALVEVYRQQAAGTGAPNAARDLRLERVISTLRADPSHRVTLAEAARWAEMSPQYFSRTFSAQTGRSFRDFVLANRLDRAHTLLTESTMTVGEVARALGYPDTYLFSRQVAARFGRPPSRLRSAPPGTSI
ncbi:MAG: helix-turn-helix domain-containing protein, partial [Dermatophilaceae bacterium]